MKRIAILAVMVMCVVLPLCGCGSNDSGSGQESKSVSVGIDGVWKYTDGDNYSVLTVEGDKAILEDSYSGIDTVYTCEINGADNTILISDDYGGYTTADYEIIQDKLILTERFFLIYGDGERIVFRKQ